MDAGALSNSVVRPDGAVPSFVDSIILRWNFRLVLILVVLLAHDKRIHVRPNFILQLGVLRRVQNEVDVLNELLRVLYLGSGEDAGCAQLEGGQSILLDQLWLVGWRTC